MCTGAEDGDSLHPSRIVRANFDGTGLTELFKGDELGFNNAQMLKLDLANGHVYWNAFSGWRLPWETQWIGIHMAGRAPEWINLHGP